jgi:chromosome segregation ATPase
VQEKVYIDLGGDPELAKLLADEDKEFETLTEKYRAELKRWQEQKIKELDEYKGRLEGTLKQCDAVIPPQEKWLATEDSPAVEKIKADAQALGNDKLGTEPGKQLMHQINEHTEQIAKIKRQSEFNKKVQEKLKASMETLKERYKDVDQQYEAGETFLKERRTELDNLTEMERMDLQSKIMFLQNRPKPVRDRIQKQTEKELERVNKLAILEAKAEDISFEEEMKPLEYDPIDWAPVQAEIEKLKAASVEDLKKDDPKLADIRAEYEKAGGDSALFDKRVAEWKQNVEAQKNAEQERTKQFQGRSEKLRGQLDEADMKMRELDTEVTGYKGIVANLNRQLERYEEREKAGGEPLTPQEKADKRLIERDKQRWEAQIKNLEAQAQAAKNAKAHSETQADQERNAIYSNKPSTTIAIRSPSQPPTTSTSCR